MARLSRPGAIRDEGAAQQKSAARREGAVHLEAIALERGGQTS
jgi:hypothetical protein